MLWRRESRRCRLELLALRRNCPCNPPSRPSVASGAGRHVMRFTRARVHVGAIAGGSGGGGGGGEIRC